MISIKRDDLNSNGSSINFKTIIILSLIFSAMVCFFIYDYHRVQQDFSSLISFLNKVRYSAIYDKKQLIIRFQGHRAVMLNSAEKPISSVVIPTLFQVNYNTTLGNNMIVFSPGGTHTHNVRIHGGDIRLRSWLGFKKNIAVNCNGLVSEGIYPED